MTSMAGRPSRAIPLGALLLMVAPVAAAEPFQVPPITVPEGFVVELAAAPPLVRHPMMAGFDERGRLFIAESAGQNLRADKLQQAPPNFVRMLEDTDGDGRFDRSTIFADKMTLPMGALWHEGALYVASPPSIWRLEDADGDGVAEKREEIVNKFGFTGNAASIHGCFLGPCGRIYWCDGRHGHDFADGRKGLAARVFSCRPDGSDVQIFCGGGMDNPVEVAFSPAGEMFGTMTFYNPDKARHDALVHFVYGGVYPKVHPCLSEFKRTGELMPPLSRFGVVAPSGMTRYRGTAMGEEFRDDLFSVQFNTHKVLWHDLARDGATYRSNDHDFLVSTSSDFHPTDVLQDADGSLLVIDTGGWFRIGCPTSQVAKPDILGAIYRIRRADAKPVEDPRGLKLAWGDDVPHAELAGRLADERHAVRDRAIGALARRGDAAIDPLIGPAAQHRDPAVRWRAVWTCARIGTSKARNLLVGFTHDESPDVRQAAVRSLGVLRERPAVARLIRLVREDEPAVRREAATALGLIGDPGAVPALLESLRAGGDRFVEHATLYALIEINQRGPTLAGLSDPSPIVRRGALIALDQMDDGNLTRDLVGPLLDTDDAELQRTALEVIGRHGGWAAEITGLLGSWLAAGKPLGDRAAQVRGAVLAFRRDPGMQTLVADALASGSTPTSTRLLLWETIARSELDPLPEPWTRQLAIALRSKEDRLLAQAVATAAATGQKQFEPRLLELAHDETRPFALRLAAAAAVGRWGRPLAADAYDLLANRLHRNVLPLDRLTAAEALGAAALTDQQRLQLTKRVGDAGPLEIAAVLAAFDRPGDEPTGKALLAALAESPGRTNVRPARLEQLLKRYPDSVRAAAAPLLKELTVDTAVQRARLADLESKLGDGDATRGKALFSHKKTACAACHRIGSEGGTIGPNLSKIGEVRNPRDLLEAILYPSSSFARGYESYTVATDDGRLHTGLIGRETSEAIYLRTAGRAEVRIPRGSIAEMIPSQTSIMPQGLDKTISESDLRDLIAYLRSLK